MEVLYPDGAPIRSELQELSAQYPDAVVMSEWHDIIERVGECYAFQNGKVLVDFESSHFLVDETCSTQINVFDLYIPESMAEAANVKCSRACSDIDWFSKMFVNQIFTEHEYRKRNPTKTAQLQKAFDAAVDSLNVLHDIDFAGVVWDIGEDEAQSLLHERLPALRGAGREARNAGENVGLEAKF